MNRKEFIKSTLLVGGSIAMPSTLGAVANGAQDKKNEPKKKLWMFLSHLDKKDIHLIIPTLAWIAEKAGIAFECLPGQAVRCLVAIIICNLTI